jgi:hypothetical protein
MRLAETVSDGLPCTTNASLFSTAKPIPYIYLSMAKPVPYIYLSNSSRLTGLMIAELCPKHFSHYIYVENSTTMTTRFLKPIVYKLQLRSKAVKDMYYCT